MCYLLLNIYLVLLESFLCAKLWKCNFSVQFEQNWQGVSGLFDSKKTSIGLFIFSFQTSFLSVSATSSLLNFVRKRYDIFLIVYNKLVEDQWTAFPLNYSDLSEPFFCFHSFHATHPNINFRKLFQFCNNKINPKLKFSPLFFLRKLPGSTMEKSLGQYVMWHDIFPFHSIWLGSINKKGFLRLLFSFSFYFDYSLLWIQKDSNIYKNIKFIRSYKFIK